METIITGIIVTVSSSFINFIIVNVYNKISGNKKNFFWKHKKIDLYKHNQRISFDELKKRTRILVIDDEEAFPIKLFKNEGYSIEKWEKVENYGNLEKGFYDIIVLDIKGVATHISTDDGLGVLESLKKNNPSQIIIAYSQHSFDLSKSRFWEMADEKIAKPSDFLKIKKIIDNLINKLFKPERYVKDLERILNNYQIPPHKIQKIKYQIEKSITKKEELNYDLIKKEINNSELLEKVKPLIDKIIKFY